MSGFEPDFESDYGFNLKGAPNKGAEKPVIVQPVTANRLSELDLDTELLASYKEAKLLLETIKYDEGIAPNHKVQAISTCSSVLHKVVEMQERLYNLESLKAMETALIGTLKAYPDLKEQFLAAYKITLEGIR